MQPFIECPDIAQVTLKFHKGNQILMNVIHFKKVGYTSDEILDLLADVKTWFNTHCKSTVPNDASLFEMIGTDLNTQYAPAYVYTDGLPITGTQTHATIMPNNVTVAVKLNTANRGRSYRGRIYIPGVDTYSLDSDYNHITSAYATALITAYSALMTSGNFHDFVLVVLSRYNLKEPRPAGVGTTVNMISANLALDSQRRRLPERGR